MSEFVSLPQNELEELIEPIAIPNSSQILNVETSVTMPDGTVLTIISLIKTESQVNLYKAISPENQQTFYLYQADRNTQGSARLKQEEKILKNLDSPMFSRFIACWEDENMTFLVRENVTTNLTLADAQSYPVTQILSIFAQVATALDHLHQQGWVYLALRPTQIILDKPVKILDLSRVTRIGEKPSQPFSYAGYSPPDLNTEEAVDVRIDIYGMGALLYQAVTGKTIPETGIELSRLPTLPGVRQILHRCLGERESRYPDMTSLHQDLLRLQRRIQPTFNYTIAIVSSIGLDPSRTTNQDACGYLSGKQIAESGTQTWAIVCLADGMGGMAAGEIASDIAIKSLLKQASRTITEENEITATKQVQWVKEWTQAANEAVFEAMEQRQVKGGCTLICACLVNSRLTLAHVGDSRLYLLRHTQAEPLTRDHSLPMSLVLQGEISLEAVRNHPDRSKIFRSLGDRFPLPDYYIDGLDKATGQMTLDLQTGDILLLCSDGLWENVLETEMIEIINQFNLQEAANELIKLAEIRDPEALDNTTVILLRLDQTLNVAQVSCL